MDLDASSRNAASPSRRPRSTRSTFRALYKKTKYVVETADGWSLVITRYRPVKQPFPQPLFGEPLLLVHGFSQNRHAWTSGEFVKNLLFFGRGHPHPGAARARQELHRAPAGARRALRPPAARRTSTTAGTSTATSSTTCRRPSRGGEARSPGGERIFYCGHSMGGMLGYGYAGIHDDFEGLITIGVPGGPRPGLPAAARCSRSARPLIGALDRRWRWRCINARAAHAVTLGRQLAVARAAAFAPRSRRERAGAGGRRARALQLHPGGRLAASALEKQLARAEVHPVYDAPGPRA